jgi:hypothetical protein
MLLTANVCVMGEATVQPCLNDKLGLANVLNTMLRLAYGDRFYLGILDPLVHYSDWGRPA